MVNPPTNLKCSIGGPAGDLLTSTWTASTTSGITEYRIHIYNGSKIEKEIFVPGSQTNIMWLTGSGTYSIHVRALVTRTNYSSSAISSCIRGSGVCSGTPGPVTGLKCSKSGSKINVSWKAPSGSGGYDRFRVHYYIGSNWVKENFVTGTSDSYTSDNVDSVHVRAMCGTKLSSSVASSCITTVCTPNWQCEAGNTGYEYDVNNCGNPRRTNAACGSSCVPNYVCRQPLNNYEYDVNNCGGADRLNDLCKPVGGTTCGTGEISIFGSCQKGSTIFLVGVGIVGLVILMK